ncbi:MAG: glycoside hydrolase family 28 protein [Promicromonosporaceae bacterium]|nr:glycoside hydrolase family 28 protein [Promicromonosporaceae bacterium]
MRAVSTDYPCIQNAIDAVAADASEGGEVVVPAGTHRTGPLTLTSNLTLTLERDAIILFDDDPMRYEPVWTRWEGVECWAMRPLLYAADAQNVTVRGEGALDGAGQAWWARFRANEESNQQEPIHPYELRLAALNPDYKSRPGGGARPQTQYLRPPLVQFWRCQGVTVEGVTIRNSPFWTLHCVYSQNVTIRNARIENPADAINTDAIDIDSCSDVLIEGCALDVGDDGVTLKSGSGPDGVRVGIPTRNVAVRDCTIYASHGGIAIGSETAGGIENVDVDGCRFEGTQRGVRLKTRRTRGGTIRNISMRNLSMDGVWCPVVIGMYFQPGIDPGHPDYDAVMSLEPQPITDTTPRIDGVRIENVTATNVRSTAAFLVGLPEAPIENVSIDGFAWSLAPDADLLDTSVSEYTGGLFHTQDRGVKIINAKARLS